MLVFTKTTPLFRQKQPQECWCLPKPLPYLDKNNHKNDDVDDDKVKEKEKKKKEKKVKLLISNKVCPWKCFWPQENTSKIASHFKTNGPLKTLSAHHPS